MRLVWLTGSLALALLIAIFSLQAPRPAPLDAPVTEFSAARAMVDIREIAQRPHPVGSADHARVQALLLQRMQALGLQTSTQTGPISQGAARYLERLWGDPQAANFSATNLIGVLPGQNPALPAVAMMAHYDTVPRSAGAADDTTGVAGVLEAVRAIRARGPTQRTLVVLFTDAEEIGLDGARVFWGGHPLRDRIGAVVNLEARGGGGRAMMFETGRGNSETIALFGATATRAPGGVTSNSLSVFVYELMPNGTDFTIPKDRGVQGLNLAFIGRADQYHTSASTPDALDQGAVQHIGGQALEATDALLRAPTLPARTANNVYADVFGRFVIMHPPALGWLLALVAVAALVVAAWRARRRAGFTFADAGRGAIDSLWFLSAGVVVVQAVRLLGGPLSGRADSPDAYYVLLSRLPWMEAGAGLAVLALILALLGGRTRPDRRIVAGALGVVALFATVAGGISPVILISAALAIGLSLAPGLSARTVSGGWLGVIALVLLIGLGAQAFAPETAFIFLWPALLAALIAALCAVLDPGLTRPISLAPIAVGVVLCGGWLLTLAHPVFLGIGMDLPAVLMLIGLLGLTLIRPLSVERATARPLLMLALAVLVLGAGVSFAGRIAEPMPAASHNSASG